MWRLVVVLALCACHPAPPRPTIPPAPACIAGSRVIVLGQVRRPGAVACRSGMRLVDALRAAGGFTPLAWRNHIRIRRGERIYIVRIDDILERRADDVTLSSDDVILVEQRDL